MPRSLEDHFLFLNWNERGTDIVRELHHEVLRRRNRTSPIVVLTSEDSPGLKQLTQLDNGREEAFDQVYSCFGDPTDEAALKQANAKSARTVVILADEKHGDARTIRSILGLRKIAEEAGRSNLHVVAELIDPANDKVLKHLADGFPGRLESVSGPRLRTCLLSQAALIEGITKFYTDLLSVKDKTNEVYAELIPASAVGMTFRDYAALVVRTSHPASPLIPVGVQRKVGDKEDVYTNPKHGEEGAILAEGDKLILIAYGPPDENALPIPERTSVTDGRSAPPTVARVELSFSDHS